MMEEGSGRVLEGTGLSRDFAADYYDGPNDAAAAPVGRGASIRETVDMADAGEIAKRLSGALRAHLLAFPNNGRGCGGAAKALHEKGLLMHVYPSRFTNKPALTPLGLAVRNHLARDSDGSPAGSVHDSAGPKDIAQ